MTRLIGNIFPVITRRELIEDQSLIGFRSHVTMFVTVGHAAESGVTCSANKDVARTRCFWGWAIQFI